MTATLPGNARKPRLLILSHVLPFPRSAGQHQRVFYTLRAAREAFHVTFATTADDPRGELREQLQSLCDDVILLPAAYNRTRIGRWGHRALGLIYAAGTGLKRSNYAIGCVEFHPSRIEEFLGNREFDCVLYEYWHAVRSVPVFQKRRIPCVLDMHDVLWMSYARSLSRGQMPRWWVRSAIDRYRVREEDAWRQFDALVAINRAEETLVRRKLGDGATVFYAPMGTDLRQWPYSIHPVVPPRLVFYGAFSSPANCESAERCVAGIMPRVWQTRPDVELWLVGSNPPDAIVRAQSDPRVHVTGYVEQVQGILNTMSGALCPWTGTWGFRSRLIELMALGVPVVVTPDAVHGMDMRADSGVLLGEDDTQLAKHALRLVNSEQFQAEQSRLARQQVEEAFSFERTYTEWFVELDRWLRTRRSERDQFTRLVNPGPRNAPTAAVTVH